MTPDWAKLKPVNSITTNTTLGAPIYPQSEVVVTPYGHAINAKKETENPKGTKQ